MLLINRKIRKGIIQSFTKKTYQKKTKTIINVFKEDIKFSGAHFTIFEDGSREDLHVKN